MKGKPLFIRRLLTLVVAVLVLAGCGAQPPATAPNDNTSGQPATQAPSDAPSATQPFSPGTFTFTADGGGTGVLELPGAAVPEIEELRALVGGEPVEYVTAKVDNRSGTVPVNMYQVQVFNPEGRQYTYTGAADYVDELRRKLPTDAPAGTYNRFVDLGNSYLDDASPHEVKDFVLVGEPVPSQITGVTVYATGGFNPAEATPVK